jgi:hypothetical protein
MAGQVAQGDRAAPDGRHPHPGRQVAGQRILQPDQALLGQVGQQQPGEHFGDGADLKDRAATGGVLGAGADAAIPNHALRAALQAPDHQADAPAGPHGPLGQKVHRVQPDHIMWSSGCSHACSTSGWFAAVLTAPATQTDALDALMVVTVALGAPAGQGAG